MIHSTRNRILRRWILLGATALLVPNGRIARAGAPGEGDYYEILPVPIPKGIVLEPGALKWLPDGRLAVATRLGDIYFLAGVLGKPLAHVRYKRFARGLHELLGLDYKDGWIYCTQRGEVSRLRDTDFDDRADVFETINDEWGMTGNYHEYAFGSKFDREGNLWVALCLTGSFTSEAKFRGWCVRITPEGKMIPTCSGIRSPGGIAMNADGKMFYTDNQGVWNGTSGLKYLKPGGFMGNPSGNIWYDATSAIGPRPPDPVDGGRMYLEARRIPQLVPTAVWFPYVKMGQSASGIICDLTGGKFGPFSRQLFVCDQTQSTVMRVFLEKVEGVYQGALFPFLKGFSSGNLSVEFSPDGSLFVGGTDRGWGARGGKPFALERVRWKHEVPFEVHEMHVMPDGFELRFTRPVEVHSAEDPAAYQLETYTYIYQSSYGSPEVDRTRPVIRDIQCSPGRDRVRLRIEGLRIGHVHELHLNGVRSQDGKPLLHPVCYYTLNVIPKTVL